MPLARLRRPLGRSSFEGRARARPPQDDGIWIDMTGTRSNGALRHMRWKMAGGVAVVVVAAGRGTRAGAGLPKQYRLLSGVPVIRRSLTLFAGHPQIDCVQPVIHRDDAANFSEAGAGLKLRPPALGGATRQG